MKSQNSDFQSCHQGLLFRTPEKGLEDMTSSRVVISLLIDGLWPHQDTYFLIASYTNIKYTYNKRLYLCQLTIN